MNQPSTTEWGGGTEESVPITPQSVFRPRQSTETHELQTALAKAQGAMGVAHKDAENPHFKSKYATLAAVVEAARKPLADNGLSFTQPLRREGSEMVVVTRLMHASGQWIEDDGQPLLLDKRNMQGLGSAQTYARRYGLMGALGIAPADDDDGNAAVRNAGPEQQSERPEFISDEEKAELIALQQEVEADTKKFLIHFGVATLDQLPKSRFKDAKAALEKKRKFES